MSSHPFLEQPSSLVAPSTPPRPGVSPTKRAHASPSPNSSPSLRQSEPSDRMAYTMRAEAAARVASVERGAALTSEGVIGLGVAGMARNPYEQRDVSAEKEGVRNPDEQTRKLMDMPVAMANALSRLSSQHHMSEYNLLKRVMATNGSGTASPAHSITQPPLPPLPRPMPLRTQSTPEPITTALFPSILERPAPVHPVRSEMRPVPIVPRSVTPAAPEADETTLIPIVLSMKLESPHVVTQVGPEQRRENIAKMVSEAFESGITRPLAGVSVSDSTTTTPGETNAAVHALLPGMQIMNGVAVKTSASHPMNISTIIPVDVLALLSSQLLPNGAPALKTPLAPSKSIVTNALDPSPRTPFIIQQASSLDLWDLTRHAPKDSTATPTTKGELPAGRQLGNFFLSSCPGKKVRLDAISQVKGGRGGICRDLRVDLKKAQDEGVRLIICCLDDQELSFLGAPWNEYVLAAASLSLPVIRVPMYEGYAPSSPAELDEHLSRIVRLHTLRGEGVLAHCRGGIGRAGLVACCWMIKMGFIGAGVGGSSMQVVERVIDVVRRRRSVKSIESTQQVAFLLEYIEYLHDQAHIVNAVDMI